MAPKVLESSTDRYVVSKQIGAGGSGLVLLVQSTDRTQWAAKVLDRKKATSDKRIRFQNELFFGLKDNHKNILLT